MTVTLRITGLDELQRRLKATDQQMGAALESGLVAGAVIVQEAAQRKVPVRTGKLQGSISPERVTGIGKSKSIAVGISGERTAAFRRSGPKGRATNPFGQQNTSDPRVYGPVVEFGSGPHVIRPKRAKVLAWPTADGMAFASQVNHPGTRAHPFLIPALNDNRARINRAILQRIEQLLRRGT